MSTLPEKAAEPAESRAPISPSVADLTSSTDNGVPKGADDLSPAGPDLEPYAFQKSYRFWMVLITLSFTILLTSLEGTVVITSLPFIVSDLSIGSNYVWVSNVFLLSSAAVQPLFGQFSDLFGRKAVLLSSLALYMLGSGLAGGANTEEMLLGGRVVQGVGSGGLNTVAGIIVADLVPLRYRGIYESLLLMITTIGFSIGPFVGGALVEHSTWRWVFYINLPIGGSAFVLSYFFMHLRYNREVDIWVRLKEVDYMGNCILMGASISVLVALTWAGPIYPWSDARVLAPLLVGLAGFIIFGVYESSGIPKRPVIPLRLFPNRTSIIIYVNSFILSMLNLWGFFYFPIYFQAVRLSTPSMAGVQTLPLSLIAIPGASASAFFLARLGKFKMLHVVGWLLMAVGMPSCWFLRMDSPTGYWVGLLIIPAVGCGMIISTLMPAFQAAVAEADQAAATATFNFVRMFGLVWGIAAGGAVLNAYAAQFAYRVDDPEVRTLLSAGDAYASATRAFVMRFEEPVRTQIREVFMLAIRRVFVTSAAFSGTAFVLSLFEKNIPLRTELVTEFGLEEDEERKMRKEKDNGQPA